MRTTLRSKVTLLFIAFAVAIFAVAGTAMALVTDPSGNTSGTTAPSPTITSDKADYAPGELVTLTGGNWQPGESVNIKVNDDVGQTWSRNVDVSADDSGNITDSFNLPDWFVATYTVTATGPSGTATTSFTDGNVTVRARAGNTPLAVSFPAGAIDRFNNTTCTAPVADSSDAFSTNGNNNNYTNSQVDANNTQSVLGEAPSPVTVNGTTYTFTHWTAESPSELVVSSTGCISRSTPNQGNNPAWQITANYTANSAPTNVALSPSSVAENQASGTEVGTLSSTDANSGDTHTYTLVSGTGDADNASFSIVGDKLKTATSFNFENKSSYSVRVRSTDAGGLTFEKQLTVTVTNVNEAPTDVSLSANSVAENQPSGTAVGNFSSTDPDSCDTFTYTLVTGTGSADNGQFTIDSSGTLKTSASFNFENKNSYSVRVRSTDSGNATFEKVFTVNVTNVNEAPTDISLSANSVAENQPSGTAVGNFSSTDEDASDSHTYTLVAGLGDGDNGQFTIDSSGTLKTAASFNFEADNSYSIRVKSQDAGGLSTQKQFTINVTNVNEAPGAPGTPTLSGSNPNNGAFTLNWSAATDEDGDTLTYELQHKRNDQSTFSTVKTGISGTSYEFGGSSGNALEDEGSWTYQVRASDGSLVSSFAGPSAAIRADRTGPSFTCPTNATFQLNSGNGSQNVSVSPTDPDLAGGPTGSESGVNTTAGQLSGTVSTTTVTTPTSPKQVTFTAVDNVGNQTQTTCNFHVVYGGGFIGFQQPINGGLTSVLNTMTQTQATQAYSDDDSRFKLGSTVPVKFELRDASGAPVTNATNIKLFVSQADSKPDPGQDEVFSTSAATTGNLFRLADATTGTYIFNLSTKSGYLNPGATTPTAFTSQGTYKLSAVLDDGSSRSVNIQLVK